MLMLASLFVIAAMRWGKLIEQELEDKTTVTENSFTLHSVHPSSPL